MKAKLLWVTAAAACAAMWIAVPSFAANRERGAYRPLRSEMPVPEQLRTVTSPATASDPLGDTFGTSSPQIDATSLSATFGSGFLEISATFATPISVPDSGQSNALDGFVDIDADQNGNTGRVSHVDALNNGSAGLGNEFFIDLFTYDSADGRVSLVDDITQAVVARVPLTVTTTSFSVRIPLSAMGDDGRVDTAIIVGTPSELTDVVPNQGSVASSPGQVSGGCTPVDTGDLTPCVEDATTLCLTDDRFEVTTSFVTVQEPDGVGMSRPLTDDTGSFWFFDVDNVEVVVKVLEACVVNDRFWLFAGGLTNVEVEMMVRDTETGLAQVCVNPPQTPFQPIQNTNAFDTCP